MSRLKRLIQEIHRRSLWQVLGIYLVGAWVAFQGIEASPRGSISLIYLALQIRQNTHAVRSYSAAYSAEFRMSWM